MWAFDARRSSGMPLSAPRRDASLPDMDLPIPSRSTRAAFETLAVIEHRDPAGHSFVTEGAINATSRALGVTEQYVTDVLRRADALPSALRDDVLYLYAVNVERGVKTYCRTRSGSAPYEPPSLTPTRRAASAAIGTN